MTIGRLIVREIRYRKLNFLLGVLGVVVAVGALVGELLLLRMHDLRTEVILAAKRAETQRMMNQLEEDFRKITVKMGFNLLILPQGQTLSSLYDDEAVPRYLPEEYAARLAKSKLATVNHVLPSLTQRVKWPERNRKIMLMGVRGEVYIQSKFQKPILETVPPGTMVVGYELHQSLKLAPGDKVEFMGRPFTISKLMDEKGNWDDATLWINLKEAQELLHQPGQINAIMALECGCAPDRLAQIRQEVTRLLPETQVIEFASQAVARAEARSRAAQQAADSLQQEEDARARLKAERESFAALLVPVVLLGAAVWLSLLSLANVRDRRPEIGILRAMGLRARQILLIFVGKAALVGLVGAALGYGAGVVIGLVTREGLPAEGVSRVLFNPSLMVMVILAAPVLTALVSWVPALYAAQQDPAEILRQE